MKPQLRYQIAEEILKSLDEPDEKIDEIWKAEAERRVAAVKEGRLKTIPIEEIL